MGGRLGWGLRGEGGGGERGGGEDGMRMCMCMMDDGL